VALFKTIIPFVLKLLIAITPFILVPYILKKGTNHPDLARFFGTTEDRAQKVTLGILAVLDLAVLAVYETWTHFLPQRQARRIADVYVEGLFKQLEGQLEAIGMKIGKDIRANIMFVRRSAFTLFFRKFVWFANRGFEGSHRDNKLGLFVGQGLCGQAFRKRQTLSVDLRSSPAPGWWPSAANFWLLPGQRKKTNHLTAILTIPIFAQYKDGLMTTHEAVGVINIDAVSTQGADGLLSNKIRLDEFFKESGTILALFALH